MRGRVIAFSALGILVFLGVVWFFATHDRVMGKEWVGPSGEARTSFPQTSLLLASAPRTASV